MIELDIVERLRGKVRVPVNDGAGLLNGKDFFERSFPASKSALEAADEIERLRAQLRGTKDGRDWHIDTAAEFLAALRQIDTVCADNAAPACKHDLALKFIRSIVAAVTHEPPRLAISSEDRHEG